MWHTSLFKRSSEAPFSFLHSGTIVGSWAPPFPSWMRAGKRWVSKELVEVFAAGHAHTGALFQVQSRTREDISSGFWWWLWKLEVTPSRASTVPLLAVHPRPSELTVPGQVYLILEQELMGSGAISNKKCTLSRVTQREGGRAHLFRRSALCGQQPTLSSYRQIQFPKPQESSLDSHLGIKLDIWPLQLFASRTLSRFTHLPRGGTDRLSVGAHSLHSWVACARQRAETAGS